MNFQTTRPLILSLLLAGATACTTAPPARQYTPQQDMRNSPWQQPRAEVVEAPVMYGRDGSVVGGPAAGSVTVDGPQTTHEVGSDGGSRMYLLERFQETVEENESLQFEVQGLAAALDLAEANAAQLHKDLELLQETFEAKETENAKLTADNLALAERLTTAQIRRLQAEKLLIEAKIDWQRIQHMTDTVTGSELPVEASTSRTDPNGGQR